MLGDEHSKNINNLNKSKILIKAGRIKEAKQLIDKVQSIIYDNSFGSFLNEELQLYCWDTKVFLYWSIKEKDSLNYYKEKYWALKSNSLSNIDYINGVEGKFEDDKSDYIITIEDSIIYVRERQAETYNALVDLLSDSISSVKSDIARNRKINDSLKGENKSLMTRVGDQKKTLRRLFWVIVAITSLALIALGTIYLIQRTIIKRRNKLRDEKLAHTRAELNTLTKGKLHNLRNGYNNFLGLIGIDQNKANRFAEKFSNYLSLALNDVNWENAYCTIDNELRLLNEYCEAHKVIWPNVRLSITCTDVDTSKALFITESFTTLLHNSIYYNFQYQDSDKDCVFQIKIERWKQWVQFEVTDNGYLNRKNIQYLNEAEPDKGLFLLKRRIENEIKYKYKPAKDLSYFSAVQNDREGSTIKFIFPYATAV